MPPHPSSVQRVEDLDFAALAISTVTGVVKRKPISVSLWVIGLLLAAFAKGFTVDDGTFQLYQVSLQQARDVDRKDLNKALNHYQRADERYRNSRGMFWSCDDRCNKEYDKSMMAKSEVDRLQRHREELLTEARREVGIWSVFGVQDVRDTFWTSWKAGKDWAARYTMMDAFFMMLGGREETLVSMILQLIMQYVINLTMGLVGAFFFFVYNVYSLIVSYGEPFLSGLSFFLLVLVAGMATVGSYLVAVYGTVAGGGILLVKQAAKKAAVQNEQRRRPQQVQWGAGRPGGFGGPDPGLRSRRTHQD